MDKDKKLSIQVLVVTMNQKDYSLLDEMNIQSDALIGNQCDRTEVETIDYNGKKVTYYSFNERGVGLNRNNLLLRADADIVLFSDEDVKYIDGYEDIVVKAFEEHPEADVITFNVIPLPETIPPDLNTKWKRIRWYNCLKYGAPRIACRLEGLRRKNLYYSLMFGGGAKFSSGEDSLFIMSLVKSGLKVYAYPEKIGTVSFYDNNSSWFKGFNEKYFMDKGILFYYMSEKHWKFLCLQYVIRKRGLFREYCSPRKAYKLMKQGVKKYKNGEL